MKTMNERKAETIKTIFFVAVTLFGCLCSIGGLLACDAATVISGAGCGIVGMINLGEW